jgi:hypothetical protein
VTSCRRRLACSGPCPASRVACRPFRDDESVTTASAGIRAKIARALELLLELDECLHAYLDADPFTLQRQVQPDGVTHVFVLKVTEPAPVALSVLVGEVVHQLRSAVDHVAYGLVVAAGNTPTRQTGFPVCTARPAALKVAGGVTAEALAAVDAVQPYQRRDPLRHPLHVLNTLWNIDKHRNLLVTALQSTGSRIWLGSPDGSDLVPGHPSRPAVVGHDGILGVFRYPDGDFQPDTEVTAQGSSFIGLSDKGPWPADQPVQLLLEELHQYVALVLLPMFEPLLEPATR